MARLPDAQNAMHGSIPLRASGSLCRQQEPIWHAQMCASPRAKAGGGLTGSPDESGSRRREKGLARAGNARVRRGMIQLAWRFLMFQKDSALARWYWRRTAEARGGARKTMIVALARKLLIGLWRLATIGEIPEGVVLRPAS